MKLSHFYVGFGKSIYGKSKIFIFIIILLEGWERLSMDKETFIFKLVFGKRIMEKVKTLVLY